MVGLADGISCHVFSFITELLEVNERRPKKDHCIARSHKKKRTWCLIHRMQKAYCWQWLENDHCTLKPLTQPPPCLEISFVVPSVYLMRPKPDLCVASFASRRSLPESKSCNSLWSCSLSFIFPSHRSYLTFKFSAQRRRLRASCASLSQVSDSSKTDVDHRCCWLSAETLRQICQCMTPRYTITGIWFYISNIVATIKLMSWTFERSNRSGAVLWHSHKRSSNRTLNAWRSIDPIAQTIKQSNIEWIVHSYSDAEIE